MFERFLKKAQHVLSVSGLLLCLMPALVGAAGAQTANDRPFLVQTANNVDRNLFPLYVLGELYGNMPGSKATPQEQANWIATTRAEAWHMRAIIRDQQLDPALDSLFQDCLNFTSAYETFLRQRGQIQAQREQYSLADALTSLLQGASDASDAQDFARRLGASNDDASSLGGVAGVLSGLADYYGRSQRSDAATNAALAAASRALMDSWQQTDSNLRVTSASLARRYGWSVNETGFNNATGSSSAEQNVQLMPRNPFVLTDIAIHLGSNESPHDLVQRANLCFYAAELVPVGAAYDTYRQAFLFEAATLTVLAGSAEAGDRGYSAAPVPSGTYAVEMVRTYLLAAPSDPGSSGHLLLARALGLSGRYSEAVAADNLAFQTASVDDNDGITAYRYAKLLSLIGSVDSSAQWLQKAYADGLTAIDVVRRDPDLANLRRMRPQLYAQLTTPSLSAPQFVQGWIWDDAIVRNNSPFDLTNVVLTVKLRKGSTVYPFTMSCKTIKAGGTCRLDYAVSIPGHSYDEMQATFTADQGD